MEVKKSMPKLSRMSFSDLMYQKRDKEMKNLKVKDAKDLPKERIDFWFKMLGARGKWDKLSDKEQQEIIDQLEKID